MTGHELYDRLARTPAERQKEYRALFRAALDVDFVDGLRAATNGGWALGDARFKQQIAKALGRRVAPLRKGRPKKALARSRSKEGIVRRYTRSLVGQPEFPEIVCHALHCGV